jgi:hypothetical protein
MKCSTKNSRIESLLQRVLYTKDESKNTHERMGSIKPQEKKRQVIRE